ncbi:outer membrane protein assembly factor BamB family protein [Cellulomonas alba]|uniref:PQQ-binding-like beta-propeller repeat protein n=1 Tax=Cellulomonas alba TaxID=3053467 RepID=A0ABT7SEN9_9CELL|nr:PQQ-binding-like beta-propeller repeat protein [Cellulomonas alba]MDM7854509.1 PQQ-binding-like beta-propeller repeat protein [Cellulomonas alba]
MRAARRPAMAAVELDDVPEARPGGDSPPPPSTPRTRPRRWWLVVAGVVVLALAVAQAVVSARGRAADARRGEAPGTVLPVARPLGIAWRPTRGETAVLTTGVHAGALSIGVLKGRDGSRAVVALDDATGRHVWRRAVSGPDEVRAEAVQGDLTGRTGSCRGVPSGEPAHDVAAVACLLTDGVVSWDTSDPPLTLRPATHGELLLLDARTGAVRAKRDVRPPDAFGVVGDLLVTADVQPDAHAELTATDLTTGAPRWTWTTPGRLGADASGGNVLFGVRPLGDAVALSGPDGAVTVLTHGGAMAHGPAGRGAWDVDATGDGVLLPTGVPGAAGSLLVRPGRADRRLLGRAVVAQVDDGSLDDLQLTTRPTLRAWDLATGALLWDAQLAAYRTAVVLGGRAYVQTFDGIAAVDGRTGRVVWRHAAPPGTSVDAPTSDGRALLVVQTPTTPGIDSALGAYRLGDGVPLWTATLPGGVFRVSPVGRVLVGYTTDGAVVLRAADRY